MYNSFPFQELLSTQFIYLFFPWEFMCYSSLGYSCWVICGSTLNHVHNWSSLSGKSIRFYASGNLHSPAELNICFVDDVKIIFSERWELIMIDVSRIQILKWAFRFQCIESYTSTFSHILVPLICPSNFNLDLKWYDMSHEKINDICNRWFSSFMWPFSNKC